jgi:AbrB family looped-hinge helix DNA binding protein
MEKIIGRPRLIDSRNRITLPSEVLKLLKLKPNDEVFFKIEKGKIIIGKALIKYELIDDIIGINKKK